mmetsp:Transcript_43114/g.77491  ORF Transcript_43114/g.77491 Transcript_43114/m.77491 type:complete len:200 (-) Transcript_43114:796-1395(-)
MPWPTAVPSSSAIRVETARAASLRGCVWPMSPARPRPISRQILGSCVVFPEPVSPDKTTTWWSWMAFFISSREWATGSPSSYVIPRLSTPSMKPARASAYSVVRAMFRRWSAFGRPPWLFLPPLGCCFRLPSWSCSFCFAARASRSRFIFLATARRRLRFCVGVNSVPSSSACGAASGASSSSSPSSLVSSAVVLSTSA